jgi:hypothetical protein
MINLNRSLKNSVMRWLWALATLLFLFSRASAQTTGLPPQRWLFIFDTSAAMKKRLPGTETELKNLFFNSISGQLNGGDTIGVWTFDEKLHAGEFPLVRWNPSSAAEVSSNIVAFVHQQHYAGDTKFASIEPVVGRIIDNSERLTVIVFCDGDDTLKLTPDDAGINQSFQQMRTAQKNLHQPFILVVRTQGGLFVGGTMNFPPGKLNLPEFPPLAVETETDPVTPAPPAPAVIPAPPAVVAPLVIVGTNVGTNIDDLPKISAPTPVHPVATNVPPMAGVQPPAAPSAGLPAKENAKSTSPPVNASVSTAVAKISTANTGGENRGDHGTRILIFIGAGLLFAAIMLVLLLVLHKPRAPRESLITSSMQHDPDLPHSK